MYSGAYHTVLTPMRTDQSRYGSMVQAKGVSDTGVPQTCSGIEATIAGAYVYCPSVCLLDCDGAVLTLLAVIRVFTAHHF